MKQFTITAIITVTVTIVAVFVGFEMGHSSVRYVFQNGGEVNCTR